MKKNYGIGDLIELMKPYKTECCNDGSEAYLFTEEQWEKIAAQFPKIAYLLRDNGYYADYEPRDKTILVFEWR